MMVAIASALDTSSVRKKNAGAGIKRCAGEWTNYFFAAGSS